MLIRVTWWDIFWGKRNSATNCAVARALKRRLGVDYVSVKMNVISVGRGNVCDYDTPMEVKIFIEGFDSRKFTYAFSFDFPVWNLSRGAGVWLVAA